MPAYCKAEKMITLTAPNGTKVAIDERSIVAMYANDGTYHDAAKTVLVVSGLKQAVKETMDEIEKLIAG